MEKKVLRRAEVKEKETWDLTRLYASEEAYLSDLDKLKDEVKKFKENYQGNLVDSEMLIKSLKDYEKLSKLFIYTRAYQSLHASVDQTNLDNIKRQGEYANLSAKLVKELVFYKNEVLALSDELLLEAITLDKTYEVYLNDIIREKKHQLEPNVEKALAEFNQVLNAPNSNYSLFKFAV